MSTDVSKGFGRGNHDMQGGRVQMATLWHSGTRIVEHGLIEMSEWKRRGQMERKLGFQLTNTPGEFQHAILQRIKPALVHTVPRNTVNKDRTSERL